MFIPADDEYESLFGKDSLIRMWIIPENCIYDRLICYANDGSPVIFEIGEPFTIKVGKRKFAEVTIK